MSEPLVFPPSAVHSATVILCHGMTQTAADWTARVAKLQARRELAGVKFVLPQASKRAIAFTGGKEMTAWFDLKRLPSTKDIDVAAETADLRGPLESMHHLIAKELEAVSADKLALVGFSQGGAMALIAGISYPSPVAGVATMSSWLPLGKEAATLIPGGSSRTTRVLMTVHDDEAQTKRDLLIGASEALQDMRFTSTLQTVPGGNHEATDEELEIVATFVADVLGLVE